MKLDKQNKNLQRELEHLINNWRKEYDNTNIMDKLDLKVAERVVNLTKVEFNTEEKWLLEKSLKYAPPQKLGKDDLLIECENIIRTVKDEKVKKQQGWK